MRTVRWDAREMSVSRIKERSYRRSKRIIARKRASVIGKAIDRPANIRYLIARDSRLFHYVLLLLRQAFAPARKSGDFARARRELLFARTRPCLFASPCVAYATLAVWVSLAFPPWKTFHPFCAPTYTCTYRRAVDGPRAVAIKSEKSWGAV